MSERTRASSDSWVVLSSTSVPAATPACERNVDKSPSSSST
jgi:hypothetical protein